jgi:hypothetical protein
LIITVSKLVYQLFLYLGTAQVELDSRDEEARARLVRGFRPTIHPEMYGFFTINAMCM